MEVHEIHSTRIGLSASREKERTMYIVRVGTRIMWRQRFRLTRLSCRPPAVKCRKYTGSKCNYPNTSVSPYLQELVHYLAHCFGMWHILDIAYTYSYEYMRLPRALRKRRARSGQWTTSSEDYRRIYNIADESGTYYRFNVYFCQSCNTSNTTVFTA